MCTICIKRICSCYQENLFLLSRESVRIVKRSCSYCAQYLFIVCTIWIDIDTHISYVSLSVHIVCTLWLERRLQVSFAKEACKIDDILHILSIHILSIHILCTICIKRICSDYQENLFLLCTISIHNVHNRNRHCAQWEQILLTHNVAQYE